MKLKALAAVLAMGALPAAAHAADTVKIGFMTDMSGVYADYDGKGGLEAIKMAIADFGGKVLGKKVEVVSIDHLNKADIAATKAREWLDRDHVDMILFGVNSAAGLAVEKIAGDHKKIFLTVGGGADRIANEACTPYEVQYAYNTRALAYSTGAAVTKQPGGKSWYFLTADYAFGQSVEKDASDVVKRDGGKVVGVSRHPLATADFSSFLMQAQASKAQVLGLANAGGDTANSIRAAHEFGLDKKMKVVGLVTMIGDIHSIGLQTAQGMLMTEGWYWDFNNETRKFGQRYYAKTHRMPGLFQVGDYSATLTYLKAVQAAGTTDSDKVMAKLKSMKINDVFVKNGHIRPDGTMVHDMYLMQVKKPSESKKPWDYLKLVATVPGEQAFGPASLSRCPLVKK